MNKSQSDIESCGRSKFEEGKAAKYSTWTICYTNPATLKLKCGYSVCPSCTKEWIKNNIMLFSIKQETYTCRCVDYSWDHNIDSEEMQQLLSPAEMEEINQRFLFYYWSNKSDIRKWPNEGCDYAGIIKFQHCNDKLVCEKWDFEWSDPANSRWKGSGILSMLNPFGEKELFSYMTEIIVGKPCPVCGIMIIKNYGCQIMTCACWKTEFCWLCDSRTRNHSLHLDDDSFCPMPYFITRLMTFYFIIIAINMKFYYRFEDLRIVENYFFYYTGICVIAVFIAIYINLMISAVIGFFSRNKLMSVILVVLIIFSLALLAFFAYESTYFLIITILFVAIEIIILIVAWISVILHHLMVQNRYHAYEDEEIGAFDMPHQQNLNNDLDIVRDNPDVQKKVNDELDKRVKSKGKRMKSTTLKKKKSKK